MLFIAIYWFYTNTEPEPFIVILGQFTTLLILIFEKNVEKIFKSDNVLDSKLEIENKDIVKMKDITKSNIKIK